MTKNNKARREFLQRLAVGAAALPAGAAAVDTVFGSAAFGMERAVPQGNTAIPKYIFDVRDFGAVGDGKAMCTRQIQSAVDACERVGGGKVVVPPGRYLTGPIFLKSQMEFEVLGGATLIGSTNFDDYPAIQGRWEGLDRTIFASLLTGGKLENISITGRGTLDGRGQVWWDAHRKTQTMRRDAGLVDRDPENPAGSPLKWPRARMIYLSECKNVLISGLTIINSPSWNVHPVLCEDVWIQGLSIINPGNSPNTDGIDPDSCRNVRISDCYISGGDDCVIIKSGYKQIAGHPFAPSENIVVTNCVFGEGHCGVGIGSETAGGVRNVTVSNCVCDGTRRGLTFKTARGRGEIVENVRAVNLVMRNIVDAAIAVGMFYDNGDKLHALPVDVRTPTMRNLHFSDIFVKKTKAAILIEGLLENPIHSLSVRNMIVESAATGVICTGAHGAAFENFEVNPDGGAPLSFTDVEDLELVRVRTNKANGDLPMIVMERVHNADVESCTAVAGNAALVEVKGRENRDITLALNRPPKGTKEVVYADGATEDVVVRRA
jgi:polygalacturonase